uniref:Uncharacterized protein n=1 Tax=Arundo donax TaxID=35708 RepID=A0A0A9FR26_ARUDO
MQIGTDTAACNAAAAEGVGWGGGGGGGGGFEARREKGN